MRRGVVWLKFDCSLEFPFSCGEIQIIKIQNFAQGIMRLGEFGIDLKRFQSRLSRFCHGIALRHGKIQWKQDITISQTGIGERVLWIACDCLFVERDRLRQIVAGAFFPKRSAFVVKLVRSRVAGRLRRDQSLFPSQ